MSVRLSLSFFWVLLALGGGRALAAEAYRRHVSVEWDPVEDATLYEIELARAGRPEKASSFRTKEAKWSGELELGHFSMRARTIDDRGIAGEWSAPSPVDVLPEAPRAIAPEAAAQVAVAGRDPLATEAEVLFQWSPVGGATAYRLRAQSEKGGFALDEVVTEASARRKMPVAAHYSWSVMAIAPEGLAGAKSADIAFALLGPRLQAPRLAKPNNSFVRELRWQKREYAETARVLIERWSPKDDVKNGAKNSRREGLKESQGEGQEEKRWQAVYGPESRAEEGLPFSPKWAGGRYRATLVAQAALRPDSEPEAMEFEVFSGDRSEASELRHELRKSIDHGPGWYGVATYLLGNAHYSGMDYDGQLPGTINYSGTSGTVRAGAGNFSARGPWGLLALLEASPLETAKGILEAIGAELWAIRKVSVSSRAELRARAGLFYREAIASEINNSYDKFAALGPCVGAEYWVAITPAWGAQASASAYQGALAARTPNGQGANSALFAEFGLLASYRLTPSLTGLAGALRREAEIHYQPADPAYSGRSNQISTNGTYLSLGVAYQF
jgi:hypothetical protein